MLLVRSHAITPDMLAAGRTKAPELDDATLAEIYKAMAGRSPGEPKDHLWGLTLVLVGIPAIFTLIYFFTEGCRRGLT